MAISREEGQGEGSHAGAVPEGAAQLAESAVQRESVPPFRGQAKPASSLDLLADLDEPEQLVRELRDIALSHGAADRRWKGIAELCLRAQEYFEHINQPRPNRPQP